MDFIIIYFFCFLTTYCIFAYGYVSNKLLFNFKSIKISETILIGLLFLIFLGVLLNFFISLNIYLNTVVFLLGFIFLLIFKNSINFITLSKNVAIISLIGFITFILDQSNRPDAGLYHLPYISMLNEEKIILGSVNLHFRFGHASSLQYLSSLFNNFVFNENGILIPLTIFFSTIVIYFYEEYRDNNKFLKLYSIFSLIFILTSMNRYSGFGNDDPAHMLYLVAILNFLKIIYVPDNKKNLFFNKLTYYTVNTFLIKQFYILILILPILVYFNYLKKINLQNKCNLISTILIFMWLLKNILVSGCVLYPANISCFQSLNWAPNGTLSNPIRVSIESEAWAKAWPDRSDKSKGLSEHISDYQWIDAWLKNHLKVVLKKLSPLIILSILYLIIIIFTIKDKNKIPLKRSIIKIFYLHIFFSLIWFFKFPTYRYGAAYMGVSIILLSLLLINFYNIKENTFKFLNISLIIICILVGLKNIKRIYENINITYVDYPWPKKNSFTQSNYVNFNNPIYDNKKEIIYYEAYPYTLCMYSKGPCTSFRNLDLKRQIIFRNYKMYKFKK